MKKLPLALLFAALLTLPALAAPSFTLSINGKPYADAPVAVTVGKVFTVELALSGATTGQLYVPSVPQLASHGGSGMPGDKVSIYDFYLTPLRPGDITIPAFEIVTSGGKLPIKPIRLHAAP